MRRWLRTIMVLALTLVAGAAGAMPLAAPKAPPILFDVGTLESVGLTEAARRLEGSKIVVFGEHHDSALDHVAQLRVIRALRDRGLELAVGLEVFGFASQHRLDAFGAGALPEEDLISEFGRNASPNLYRLYREILLYCREAGIPLVGLRAETDDLVKLYFKGAAGLDAAELARLPGYDPLCRPSPRYESLMKQFAQATPPFNAAMPGEGFLCDFFMGLDSVMAFQAARYAKANPDRTLVVLAGIAHAWKTGIPFHLGRMTEARVSVILPSSERDTLLGFGVYPSDADFVWWHQ